MMHTLKTLDELELGWETGEKSPSDIGTVAMITCRPNNGERVILDSAEVDVVVGVVGDNWKTRGSRYTEDGSAHPDMQIAIMNSRVIDLIATDQSQWQLAGDQFFVDFDLSADNMPIGQRFSIGTAILEVSPYPHNGCGKFTERFGSGATHFVNSPKGRELRRRGLNARVIQNGIVRTGDRVVKLD